MPKTAMISWQKLSGSRWNQMRRALLLKALGFRKLFKSGFFLKWHSFWFLKLETQCTNYSVETTYFSDHVNNFEPLDIQFFQLIYDFIYRIFASSNVHYKLGNPFFVKRSQYIRIKNCLHKQSEKACMCF